MTKGQSQFGRRWCLWSAAVVCALASGGCARVVAQVELDRVVAVVTNRVILASDVEQERRFFHLLPEEELGGEKPARALERLTTRALVEQQILREDPKGMEIAPEQLEKSLTELRQSLPGCQPHGCDTEDGWRKYLSGLELTPDEVRVYWANRMAVLRFIEMRFRSGIRIAPEEVATYYNQTLVPKYARAEDVSPLDRVEARIEEILLQEQVNALLNDWLKTLQDEGQVEVLEPELKASAGDAEADKGGGR